MQAIDRLLRPRSVAVIGASGDPAKTAGRPVAFLQQHRFSGPIYPVNPRLARIGELPCYPDVAALPAVPDVGVVLLGAERAQQAVRELASRGTAAAIVLASGYTEAGAEGARRQAELREAAGSMRVLGPNTIGLVNLTDGIVLSASGALDMGAFTAGAIGVVSQSGGILGSLLSRATARGIGLSKLVSTSNEMDLELSDFIDALVDDDATRVIALYIESVRRPDRFVAATLRATQAGKPVVAFKIGRSDAGAQAAASHTGALAGSDQMYDALFRRTGVIRAATFTDLLDISAALATGRSLAGRRVAVLTSTGGAGTLVSDALGVAGFETPPPDEATAAALRALQSGGHAALDRNPIDVTLAGLQPEVLRGAIRALQQSSSYDALALVVGSSGVGSPGLMASAVSDCLPLSDKPMLAYVSPHAPEAAALLTQAGVPAFTAAESCAAALSAMWTVTHGRPAPLPSVKQAATVPEVPLGSLDEAQAKALFAHYGIAGPREIEVLTAQEAEQAAVQLGGQVVLKLLSHEVTHKTELGGVVLNLGPQQVGGALQQMVDHVARLTGTAPQRFLVQEMLTGGIELILGLRRDALGAAVLLGMGGVTAELFKDTSLRWLTPGAGLSRDEALAMARELKTWPLLNGYRGRSKADVEALVSAVVSFSEMAAALGERLVEAEINPLFVFPEGGGVRAADGVVVVAPVVRGA